MLFAHPWANSGNQTHALCHLARCAECPFFAWKSAERSGNGQAIEFNAITTVIILTASRA